MKVEKLKLYNKYKNIDCPDIGEFIYIGIDKRDGDYIFLYEAEDYCDIKDFSNTWGLNYNEIINNIPKNKKYNRNYHSKEYVKTYIKPLLKDKLKNIINR